MGIYFSLFTAIFFGISNIFTRKGLEEHNINRHLGMFINLVIVNLINFPVLLFFVIKEPLPEYNSSAIIFFMIAGLLNTFLGRTLLFTSIELIGPSRAGSFKIIAPAIVIIIGVFFLGETLKTASWVGSMAILSGVFLISKETKEKSSLLISKNYRSKDNSDYYSSYKRGVLIGLLSGVTFGIGNIFRKLGISLFPSFIVGVAIASSFALICSVFFLIIRKEWKEAIIALKKYWLGNYFFTGMFTSFGLYSFFISLQTTPVSLANSIVASESLFTMLFSSIILGKSEQLRISTVFKASLIVLGLIILFFS